MGRLLDAYDKLQSQPFGSLSARNSNSSGLRQMGSQRATMTSALRRGIREAKRKGDFETVAKGIGMGNAYGVETTGMGSYDKRMAGGEAFADKIRKETDVNAELANRAKAGVDKLGNMPQAEVDTANPNATAGAGNGTPIKKPDGTASNTSGGDRFVARVTAEAESKLRPLPVDTPEENLRQKNLNGDLGTEARDKARREEASNIVDDVLDDPKTDLPTAVRRAVAIGGNAYQLTAAMQRRSGERARRSTGL